MIGPLQLRREGNNVRLSFEVPIPYLGNRVFHFDWNAGAEYAAALLMVAMEKFLGEKLQQVKKAAYEKGWKDAKSKSKKQETFYGDFDTDSL